MDVHLSELLFKYCVELLLYSILMCILYRILTSYASLSYCAIVSNLLTHKNVEKMFFCVYVYMWIDQGRNMWLEYTCKYGNVDMYIPVCVCTCVCVCTFMYVYVHMQVPVCVHSYMFQYGFIHIIT